MTGDSQFIMETLPKALVFGLWEEAGGPGQNVNMEEYA